MNFVVKYNELKSLFDVCQKNFLEKNVVNHEGYSKCIELSSELINYAHANFNPFKIVRQKKEMINLYTIYSELMIRTVGLHNQRQELTRSEMDILKSSLVILKKSFELDPFYEKGIEMYKAVITYIITHSNDSTEHVQLLETILPLDPCDVQTHYNLGFMYHRINNLDKSLIHYKQAYELLRIKSNFTDKNTLVDLLIRCLNGMGSIYYSVQNRELALLYYMKAYALNEDDPDINNHIGVLYTELRITDKACYHYNKAIQSLKKNKTSLSIDKDMLFASIYMNMGLAKCYECEFVEAIECYNTALKYKPRLSLAYQNKLLDLNYISHMIEDPMYISNMHKGINKIYPHVETDYRKSCPNYKVNEEVMKTEVDAIKKNGLRRKLRIGFVSGDFICHPVSYFMDSILKGIDKNIFEVYCYSMKVMELKSLYPNCKWQIVKNLSAIEFKNKIQEDEIDMLFDLSAQTGDNRLDTFALKPAPIQISYCGYPNSSGLNSMDYRLTDYTCDDENTQKYYSEKLIFLEKCFLSYTPSTGLDKLPTLLEPPCVKNGYITFGSFNRYNKINKMVRKTWKEILEKCPTARFVIKTKEFSTPKIRTQFLEEFSEYSSRIEILDYSDTYLDHLPDYNKIDISLDTFPYCGTTTTCEALVMGVPVLTLYDNVRHYHSQNVSSSLLNASELSEYITYTRDDYVKKAVELSTDLNRLEDVKKTTRNNFVNGYVCNHKLFNKNLEKTLLNLYKKHF